MRVHADWATKGFELDPAAPRIGPFGRGDLLRTWARIRGEARRVRLIEDDDGLIPLYEGDGATSFVGEPDLVDYRSPLGSSAASLLGGFVAGLDAGTRVGFDSLPAEAAAVVVHGLSLAGLETEPIRHEIAAVLDLPGSEEQWLLGLGRKQRHEVRRKSRRFEEEAGAVRLRREKGPHAVESFAAMHRAAPGIKGEFMTPAMEAFFAGLHAEAGAVVDFLDGPDGPLAAAFGFEEDDAYYLYNSAYDPGAAHLSPGIVLVTAMVSRAIRSGRRVFDFLKGDEMYKFRLGAKARPLYRVDAVAGGGA